MKPKWPELNQRCTIGANIERAMAGIFKSTEQQVVNNLSGYTIADVLELVEKQAQS